MFGGNKRMRKCRSYKTSHPIFKNIGGLFQPLFSSPPLFLLPFCYSHVFLKLCSFFVILFFFLFFILGISVNIDPSLQIISSASIGLLLNSFSDYFHFCYCNFNTYCDFYLVLFKLSVFLLIFCNC